MRVNPNGNDVKFDDDTRNLYAYKRILYAEDALKKLSDEELTCLNVTSTYHQYAVMRKRFESGACTFCSPDKVLNPTLFKNDFWTVFDNAFKNDRGCGVMLLIVSNTHMRSLREISKDAWAALYEVIIWIETNYHLPGGMLFLRFGDMRLNAGSVPHLHWNLWVPDETKEVRVPIFKEPEAQLRNEAIVREFAERYERGEIP